MHSLYRVGKQVVSLALLQLVYTGDRWFILLLLSRARRRQAREQTGKMADHLEGLSSDDEETSTDITNFNLERG